MQRKLNFYGFTVLEALLLLIVAGIIGGTGYYVWQGRQSADKTPAADTTSARNDAPANDTSAEPKPAANSSTQQYLTIKEWGVSVRENTILGSLTYVFDSSEDSIRFTSGLENTLPSECARGSSYGIARHAEGSLTYPDGSSMSDAEAEQNFIFKHVGNYFYQKIYPQVGCDAAPSLSSRIAGAYDLAFESLREE